MPYASIDAKRRQQRDWKAKRRAAAIAQLGDACRRCGSDGALEFVHVCPEKKEHRITDVLSMRAGIQEAELAKCVLLCRPCRLFCTAALIDLLTFTL